MSDEANWEDAGAVKRFMFVNRKAPHGTIYALEALEVVLISAAFDQDVSLAFLDDGVHQLRQGQNAKALGMKNFAPTFRALDDFDIDKLYVEAESLAQRGLSAEDLIVPVEVVDRERMSALMAEQDVVMSF